MLTSIIMVALCGLAAAKLDYSGRIFFLVVGGVFVSVPLLTGDYWEIFGRSPSSTAPNILTNAAMLAGMLIAPTGFMVMLQRFNPSACERIVNGQPRVEFAFGSLDSEKKRSIHLTVKYAGNAPILIDEIALEGRGSQEPEAIGIHTVSSGTITGPNSADLKGMKLSKFEYLIWEAEADHWYRASVAWVKWRYVGSRNSWTSKSG